MPPIIPFVRPVRDDSASTARIADLIRAQGRAQAEGIARAGAIRGQMWQDIGRAGSALVSDLLRIREYEDQRKAQEAQRAEESAIRDVIRMTPRDEKTGRLDAERIASEIAHINPVQALQWWRLADEQEKANFAKARMQAEEVARAAGALLLDLKQSPPDQHQPKWDAARARALESGLLDQPEDMPETVDMGWLQQTFNQARSLSDIADEILTIGKADDEEGVVLGPNEQLVGKKTGRLIAAGPKKEEDKGKLGSFEGYVAMLAEEKGAPLTTREILNARRQWQEAGRRPEGPKGPEPLSQAQRAAAERWKQAELRNAERVFREATANLDPDLFPEDRERYQRALNDLEETKERIQLSYLEQIGATNTSLPGTDTGTRRTERRTTPPPGSPGSPMGAGMAAAAEPPATPLEPMKPERSHAPTKEAQIAERLRKEGPGEYDLKDGSTWRVLPDGRVFRVK